MNELENRGGGDRLGESAAGTGLGVNGITRESGERPPTPSIPDDTGVSGSEMQALELESSVTISNVAPLQQSMQALFEASVTLVALDGREVEQVDGAGVQLLAAFLKEATERRVGVQWTGASDRLRSAAIQLGLNAELGLAPKL
ncbi:MAG: STAS domain-containing protein [Gammaproteobacteria bacterium]|nr:STAS domain-containing protein [Gammaproteobacteria bacterium]HXK55100.1 STAS domain-containing protein [Gammaproteobacteria bacterium]